jgi:hypothetical protein
MTISLNKGSIVTPRRAARPHEFLIFFPEILTASIAEMQFDFSGPLCLK